MIAEVGGMVNVSGSRIATPFAPPRPGSTPMMTPSTMPIIISRTLNGVRATAKPWNSAPISAMGSARRYRVALAQKPVHESGSTSPL